MVASSGLHSGCLHSVGGITAVVFAAPGFTEASRAGGVTHLFLSCCRNHHHCVQVDSSPTMVPHAWGWGLLALQLFRFSASVASQRWSSQRLSSHAISHCPPLHVHQHGLETSAVRPSHLYNISNLYSITTLQLRILTSSQIDNFTSSFHMIGPC